MLNYYLSTSTHPAPSENIPQYYLTCALESLAQTVAEAEASYHEKIFQFFTNIKIILRS